MAQIPLIPSIAMLRDGADTTTVRTEGFAIAAIAGAFGADGMIAIQSITPKTITTKR